MKARMYLLLVVYTLSQVNVEVHARPRMNPCTRSSVLLFEIITVMAIKFSFELLEVQ
jgi:hypothetical protein